MDFSAEHIGLSAHSPERLMSWYVTVLGATVVFDNRQKPPACLLKLAGPALIEIYPASRPGSEPGDNLAGGYRHIALRVASLKEASEHLQRNGVQITEPVKPAGGGGSVLFFKDPEGNLIHLVERPLDCPF